VKKTTLEVAKAHLREIKRLTDIRATYLQKRKILPAFSEFESVYLYLTLLSQRQGPELALKSVLYRICRQLFLQEWPLGSRLGQRFPG